MKNYLIILTIFIFNFINISGADDLSLSNAKIYSFDIDYYKIPLPIAQQLVFEVEYTNIANFVHDGVYTELTIVDSNMDTVFFGNTNTTSVSPNSTSIQEFTDAFNAPRSDTYFLFFKMFQDSSDTDMTNNILVDTLMVSENVFQRDNGIQESVSSFSMVDDYFEIGNSFEFYRPCHITSATVLVDTTTEIGASFYIALYDGNNIIRHTNGYQIQASDLGNEVTLYFTNPYYVANWNFFVVNVICDGNQRLQVKLSQDADPFTSFYVNSSLQWFYISQTPMIRVNVDLFQNTTSNALLKNEKIRVYPNPVSDEIFLEFKGEKHINYQLINMLGQIIIEGQIKTNNSIDLKSIKKGNYILLTPLGRKLICKN